MNKVYKFIEDSYDENECTISFEDIKSLLDEEDYLPNTSTIFKS